MTDKGNEGDKRVLQQIIDMEGDCLKANLCKKCPFKSSCLPQWLRVPPSKAQRLARALDTLAHEGLLLATL